MYAAGRQLGAEEKRKGELCGGLSHAHERAIIKTFEQELMGCPHQEGIDYEGGYCPNPACSFWHERDRFTGKLVK